MEKYVFWIIISILVLLLIVFIGLFVSYITKLNTCTASNTLCTNNLTTCSASNTQCTNNLATCNTSNTQCSSDLATCNSSNTKCTSDLTTCNSSKTQCTNNLASSNSSSTQCASDLATCKSSDTQCVSDLATCKSSDTQCVSDLATCNSSNTQCSSNLNTLQTPAPIVLPVFKPIKTASGSLCLSVLDKSDADGMNIIGSYCTNASNQEFNYDMTTKELKIQSSGKCVDVRPPGKTNGSDIQQYQCNGSDTQQWNIINNDDNTVTYQNVGSGKCLDFENGIMSLGSKCTLYDCGYDIQKMQK